MDDTTWFWQIVDARGLANVASDEFVALNELISAAERAEAELNAVSAAIGSPRFMDPPDGGDVSLAEQVRRMRNALEMTEAAYAGLSSMLLSVQQDCIALRAALAPFADAVENLADGHRDTSEIWESPAAMSITAGDLRRAALVRSPSPTESGVGTAEG